jgi:hypothetical protein
MKGPPGLMGASANAGMLKPRKGTKENKIMQINCLLLIIPPFL